MREKADARRQLEQRGTSGSATTSVVDRQDDSVNERQRNTNAATSDRTTGKSWTIRALTSDRTRPAVAKAERAQQA